MGPIVCGSAGKDSIKVFWISLRLHESFAAPIGATGEIAQRRIAARQSSDDGFRLNARFVHRPVTKINQLLRMPDGPGRTKSAFVTVVCCSGGVPTTQRVNHASIWNIAGPTTVSFLNIFPIP